MRIRLHDPARYYCPGVVSSTWIKPYKPFYYAIFRGKSKYKEAIQNNPPENSWYCSTIIEKSPYILIRYVYRIIRGKGLEGCLNLGIDLIQ